MHGVVVSQMCFQLAHLFSKSDLHSALHHQQDLDLVLTLRMCGHSWEKKATSWRTLKLRNCIHIALMHSNALETV